MKMFYKIKHIIIEFFLKKKNHIHNENLQDYIFPRDRNRIELLVHFTKLKFH